MFAFCLKPFREKLCLGGEYLDLKQSPSYKTFPFPNETPNLEATEPGARPKREASGPEPGDELPGPGFRTRTWPHVPGDWEGFVPTLVGLGGGQDRDAGQRWGEVSVRDEAWRRHPAPSHRRVLGSRHPAAPHPAWGREERLPPGEEGEGAGPTGVHTGARGLVPQPPQNGRGPCSFLPDAHARIFCLVASFRSINKCVTVNVKTHQSNNNGTKSKDYPSLLVAAE